MRFISTRGNCTPAGASIAIRAGMAPNGGLFVPEHLPRLPSETMDPSLPFAQRAALILRPFFEEDPSADSLPEICLRALSFPVPLRMRSKAQAVLELFHGPTLAFKDIGARFLAEFLDTVERGNDRPLTILVATSGDTGGAVAAAFFGKSSARVRVFFPKDGVSARQRAQLTGWGGNVEAYAVRGSFDDCQRLVKHAFTIPGFSQDARLTSANSINLGRLLPQATYYVDAAVRFKAATGTDPVVIVPTGNVGNVTAAFWAREMGAPIARIVLAVNANRVIPDFLESGSWEARPSIMTLANAMDVGNPSNLERLRHLYPDFPRFKREIAAHSVSDQEIRETIRTCFEESGEVLCPHTAVGECVRRSHYAGTPAFIVATAHPAKFETIVEPLIGRPVEIPEPLAQILARECHEQELDPSPNAVPWAKIAS